MKAVFDENSPAWAKNHEHNIMFLRQQHDYLNMLLKCRGYVTILDVCNCLGLPYDIDHLLSIPLKNQCWLHANGDYIDFGMKPDAEKNIIYLDFNIDIN